MTLQDQKTEEAAIRGVLDAFAQALRAGDVDAMLSHCAPDVVAFDMLGPLQHACRGLSRFGGTRRDGGRSAHWLRLTLGLQKCDARWKVAHQHVSVPFSMDDGRALLDLEP